MSERIARVKAFVDEFNAGRWESILADLPADFVYDLSRTDSPLRGVHRGADAVRRVAAEFWGAWDSVHCEVHELIERDDEVLMRYTNRFRGRQGLELEAGAWWVWVFRGDELVGITLHQGRPA